MGFSLLELVVEATQPGRMLLRQASTDFAASRNLQSIPLVTGHHVLGDLFYNAFALPVMFIGFHLAACCQSAKYAKGIIGRKQTFEKLEHQLNVMPGI